jgi:predicted acetylornithine/succinylornithine family transaminase
MSNAEWIERHQSSLTLNYGKLPAVMVKGKGSLLWDADGKEYLDLFAGFGGTILGHCHPAIVDAVTKQASIMLAVGNQFYTEPQVKLAEAIKKHGFDGRAFFCHSGAESNEAAIKLARLAGEGRYKVISMLKGFHGRTLGALSATPTADYQRGFQPLVPGFSAVPFNDLAALEKAIDKETCAVILEPIQGEGGINMPAPGYLKGVRDLCDKHKLALIFDEVWTGCGRTGKVFASQWEGVKPDIMTLGKAVGGGLPTGVMFAVPEKAALLKPGTHGCTLGGNPVCAAAALAVFETIAKEDLTARAERLGKKATEQIRSFKNASKIKEVRGRGLFIGVEMNAADASSVAGAALSRGVIVNVTVKNVLRICPALTITEDELERGLGLLDETLGELKP